MYYVQTVVKWYLRTHLCIIYITHTHLCTHSLQYIAKPGAAELLVAVGFERKVSEYYINANCAPALIALLILHCESDTEFSFSFHPPIY